MEITTKTQCYEREKTKFANNLLSLIIFRTLIDFDGMLKQSLFQVISILVVIQIMCVIFVSQILGNM